MNDTQRENAEAFFKRSDESTARALAVMIRRRDWGSQWLLRHPSVGRFLPRAVVSRVNEQGFQRVRAISACQIMRAKARPALPAIRAASLDPNVFIRQAVARALTTIRLEPEKTIPVLIKMLGDPEPTIRKSTAFALAYYGRDATSAVPLLNKAVKDANLAVAHEAQFALSVITHPEKYEIRENQLHSR